MNYLSKLGHQVKFLEHIRKAAEKTARSVRTFGRLEGKFIVLLLHVCFCQWPNPPTSWVQKCRLTSSTEIWTARLLARVLRDIARDWGSFLFITPYRTQHVSKIWEGREIIGSALFCKDHELMRIEGVGRYFRSMPSRRCRLLSDAVCADWYFRSFLSRKNSNVDVS